MKAYIIMIIIAIIVFMIGIAVIQFQYPQNNRIAYIPTIHADIRQEPEPVVIFYEPEILPLIEEIGPVPIHIERPMSLYDAINGEMVGHTGPRIVLGYIYENNWARVIIDDEYKWVNLDFKIPVWELEEFFANLSDVSVYYKNLATGFSVSLNGDRVWFGASVVKAPFALYIYQKASRGETNLDTMLTFTQADYWGGSGIIHRQQRDAQGNIIFGARFSQRELLHLMLVSSDNIATRILIRHHGLRGYTAFVRSLGANSDHVITLNYSLLTANDAGIFMREVYNFYMSGCPYGKMLMDNLRGNNHIFITSDHPLGTKSGWSSTVSNSGSAYHDIAVVFAPSPYVLVIMSPWGYNQIYRSHRDRVFLEISMFIQEFNDKWF